MNSKGYSSINIFGLATGMAVTLLIGLWVYNEYSYDRFLPGYEQVYRVKRNFDSNGDTLTFNTTSLKLADVLRKEIPEIEYVVESDWMVLHGLKVGDKKLYLRGAQSGEDFLKTFQFPLAYGNANSVMKDPYSIILSESTAKAFFGNENPINKTVRLDNKDDLKVTGILKDITTNSSLKIDWLVPFSYMDQTNPSVKRNRAGSYGQNAYQTFVKLKPGITQQQAEAKIRNIEHTETKNSNSMKSYVILQPMKDWHLYNEYKNGHVAGGFIEYVRMFSIIGILVLLIACINFINLTTARSEKRAREVGVRKAMGSQKKQLIFQFLAESLLLTFWHFYSRFCLFSLFCHPLMH
jgi:ABC-type antimicrobial peptide transport system permease subunit